MTVVMETRGMARTEPAVCARLEHDVMRWNRHHALAFCLSMISAQTRSAFVARENRFPLFRIMHYVTLATPRRGEDIRA